MVYSLKELSEKLSVTKMTVLNHAKKLDIELEKVDNALVITNEQAFKIGESVNNQKPLDEKLNLETIFDVIDQDIKNNDDQEDVKDRELQDDIINLLKQQLEDKEKQIFFLENQMNVKDNQINKLNETLDNQQKLLHNQQSLALQSNEKIKVLEIELNEIKEDNQDDSVQNTIANDNKVDNFYNDLKEDRQSDNKGFLSRLFKR
ncbi:DUF536 domain-containing protein [Macrococcus capreoli]|uniref:DUF536 domain-containing protein n=1 Tax=Macrococcus capreoli TaxID=2982690 RepID=UPI0021D5F6ED|nr:DUF536 domain-containing protein [Macrococcus sp. TMW 2.2395]MCU7558614.1 DUF536 domain-containing protein [Macrococcus sp. TMW 2.2395]